MNINPNWSRQWLLLSVYLCILILPIQRSDAETFIASIEDTQWRVDGSRFQCRLSHQIPNYGQGVFIREAGERLAFYLDVEQQTMKPGQGALCSMPPYWKADDARLPIGDIRISAGRRAIELDYRLARRIFGELQKGRVPTFTQKARFNEQDWVEVGLSSAAFSQALPDFLACESNLLPVNFDQIKRTTIYFASNSWELSDQALALLAKIKLYVSHDSTITGFFIDGHTDNRGNRRENRDIAKRRALAVSQYFSHRGLPEELLTIRFHGERYPTASNRTAKGRAKNRRTTIRLVRDDQ